MHRRAVWIWLTFWDLRILQYKSIHCEAQEDFKFAITRSIVCSNPSIFWLLNPNTVLLWFQISLRPPANQGSNPIDFLKHNSCKNHKSARKVIFHIFVLWAIVTNVLLSRLGIIRQAILEVQSVESLNPHHTTVGKFYKFQRCASHFLIKNWSINVP